MKILIYGNSFDYYEKYHVNYYNLIKTDKKAFLSYFIIYNKDKFIRRGNIFNIKEEDHFYYLLINDFENLKKCYEENKYILGSKDTLRRNLLHWAVLGNYYEIAKYLLEKGINFFEPDYFNNKPAAYAEGEISNLLIKYDESYTHYNITPDLIPKGLIIDSKENRVINNIYEQLLNERLVINLVDIISEDGEIVGKRILRFKEENLEDFEDFKNKWTLIYHGTKFAFIENIMFMGLQKLNKPLEGHIPLGMENNNIQNWADAIFGTPSIFYASKYSEIIYSDNEEWYIIIEAYANPNSYTVHQSSIYNYQFKCNEPTNLELRIKSSNPPICEGDIPHEKEIITFSILFVKRNFLDNMKDYSEQFIFKY